MSTIQEIEKRMHEANLKSRAKQVIEQFKRQTGKGSIILIRSIARKSRWHYRPIAEKIRVRNNHVLKGVKFNLLLPAVNCQ